MRLATSEMFDPTACDNSDFGQSPSAKDLKANQRTGGGLHTCRSFRFGIDSMMKVQGTGIYDYCIHGGFVTLV
jgi:hypothetical protein